MATKRSSPDRTVKDFEGYWKHKITGDIHHVLYVSMSDDEVITLQNTVMNPSKVTDSWLGFIKEFFLEFERIST